MIISIASGKGGSGKTFVATNLAYALSQVNQSVVYVDGDVEEPNGHLFLNPKIETHKVSTVRVPFCPSENCIGCGNCQSICAFNAIVSIGKQIMVFNELCHGCGACLLACDGNYLSEKHRTIGEIKIGHSGDIHFYNGTLNVGEARSTPLIKDTISTALSQTQSAEYTIIDAPPGTSCSAVAATESADLVILVAEPTRLGFHDFKLAAQMTRELGKPLAAIINRSDLGSSETNNYLTEQQIPLIATIPYSQTAARCGTTGELIVKHDASAKQSFSTVVKWLEIQRLNDTFGIYLGEKQ